MPDYAPQLPRNATHAVFDVEAQTFNAVVPRSNGGSRVMQATYNGATRGWEWAKHHNKALAKAFVDSVPTILQTTADSMDPGSGQTAVSLAATAASAALGVRDVYQEGVKFFDSDPNNQPDWVRLAAGSMRLASSGMNLSTQVMDDPSQWVQRASGYVSGAATTMETMRDIHNNPVPSQTSTQQLYVGQDHNVALGSLPGQYPPGNPVGSDSTGLSSGTPQSWRRSSASMDQTTYAYGAQQDWGAVASSSTQPPITNPAAAYAPPSSSTRRRNQRPPDTSDPSASRQTTKGKQPAGKERR